jgi:hypothetical protein
MFVAFLCENSSIRRQICRIHVELSEVENWALYNIFYGEAQANCSSVILARQRKHICIFWLTFTKWPNPFSCTLALRSTQPLTLTSTKDFPNCRERPARKRENITAICEPIVWIMWEPQHLITYGAFTAWWRDSFTGFFFFVMSEIKICSPTLNQIAYDYNTVKCGYS